jgi:hypothetical protein
VQSSSLPESEQPRDSVGYSWSEAGLKGNLSYKAYSTAKL